MFGPESTQAFYARWTQVRARGMARYVAVTTLKYGAVFLLIDYLGKLFSAKPLSHDPVFHLLNISSLLVLMLVFALIGWKVQQWRYRSLEERLRAQSNKQP
jgi:cation transporter-like permease